MINEEGLRDWFGKSKSKDGKKGWVNVVTGDSCASDKPGEGVPKCVSSSKRASMSKKERVAAQAAKRREDPGQQSKSGAAKPTNVKTDRKVRKEDMDINEAKDKKGKGSGSKDACYHKVKSRYSVWPSAYASGALVKCRKVGAANWGNSTKKEDFEHLPELTQFQIDSLARAGFDVMVMNEGQKCWKGYEKKGTKKMFGKTYNNCVKKEEVEVVDEACWKTHEQRGMKKKGGKMVPNCVPKGSVKEDIGEKIRADRERLEAMDEATYPSDFINPDGSKRSVAKPKRDNRNMRPKQHDQETDSYGRRKTVDEETECAGTPEGKDCGVHGKKCCPTVKEGCGCDHPDDKKKKKMKKEKVEEATKMPAQNGNVYMVTFSWRGKLMAMKIFFPETRRPSRMEVEAAMCKIYPGCKVRHYDDSFVGQGDGYLNVGKSDVYAEFDEGAAWTKKEGKNKSGGLNEKGRKSYERENPGSDLKAPSKKVGNPRRASFCARMKGMKKKLTSKKTASDPDSRINKSLRAWNC